jgi:TolA-binding protein
MRIFALRLTSVVLSKQTATMKGIISLAFCFALTSLTAQNFFVKQLDHFFPNRKSKQIERLTVKNDSLQRANDSLAMSVTTAAEKIVHLKKEVINLKTDVFNEKETSKTVKEQLEDEVSELLDSITKINFTLVTCTEESAPGITSSAPIIINRCTWRHYQVVEKGVADTKGRYTWGTELFNLKSGTAVKITNNDLFKPEKTAELESKINARFEEDYNAFKASSPGCFYNKKSYAPFTLSQMRIALNDNSEIIFEADFGLADTCFPISSSSTGFKINELREFLKE